MHEAPGVTDYRCRPCGGLGYIDTGSLVIFPEDTGSWPKCRCCGGSGVFVSRARAGLACVEVAVALEAA